MEFLPINDDSYIDNKKMEGLMTATARLNNLNSYLRVSVSRIASEIKRASAPKQELMRAVRANPFNLSKAIEMAGKSESDAVLHDVLSNETMPVSEVASIAENLHNAPEIFLWALKYSSRDISRIAAVLQSASHPTRIVPAIIQQLEKNSSLSVRIGDLFSNPNMSRRKREELAVFIRGDARNMLEATLTGPLPERASFFGIPVCAGNFGNISDMALNGYLTKDMLENIPVDTDELRNSLLRIRHINAFGGLYRPASQIGQVQSYCEIVSKALHEISTHPKTIEPAEAAKELMNVSDLYLRRGLLSPLVMGASLASEIMDLMPEEDATQILIGMGNGPLWNFMHYADIPEDEAGELLEFK